NYLNGMLPFLYTIDENGVLTSNEFNKVFRDAIGENRIASVNGFPIAELSENGVVSTVPPYPDREIALYDRFRLAGDEQPSRDIVVWIDPDLRQRARLLAGIGLLGIGLLVFWLRPDTRSSAGFLFFSLVLGTFFLLRSVSSPHRDPI